MSRSRNQLASAYAPGATFTFEGGTGACSSIPDADSQYYEAHITETTKRQILARVDEIAASWFQRAYGCRDLTEDDKLSIPGELCVDEELLDPHTRKGTKPMSFGRVAFIDPVRMSYLPAPLAFQCRHCKLFRDYRTVQAAGLGVQGLDRDGCPHPQRFKQCDWQQVDVVHVHWSGSIVPPQPGRFDWDDKTGEVRVIGDRCVCGKTDFLLRDESPNIGKWFFQCAHCNAILGDGRWLQRDPFTIEILQGRFRERVRDAAMEATPYRASAAYYPQAEQFILFDKENEGQLRILEPQRMIELEAFIAERYGFHGQPMSAAELEAALCQRGYAERWERYDRMRRLLNMGRANGMSHEDIVGFEKDLANEYHRFFFGPDRVLSPPRELPTELIARLVARTTGASRFDPFRLALEHAVLSAATLDRPRDPYGRRRFVPFADMDTDLCPSDNQTEIAQIQSQTKSAQARLHFARLGLIREFDLCRFTFGHTRVSALPVTERHKIQMPVRLRLFPKVNFTSDGSKRHPIYVITQSNEAIYVRLEAAAVFAWLKRNGAAEDINWTEGDAIALGGHLLERSHLFGRFLDSLSPGPTSAYLYVFTLLHTLAHSFMKTISATSGLDLGSLGEYIFPTDLSFVVYRSGTTMDLGNLSALWRNENSRFLSTLLEPRTWACNSGSLCAEKGGACPDCILVPETSCIAQNVLLSRSVVRGGISPKEDQLRRIITGFLGDM
jgi:hypothetical protein